MNRIPVGCIPGLPESLHPFVADAALYDSSCSPNAKVWFSEAEGGIYIKTAPAGTLKTEAEMNAFFHSKKMGAEVLSYLSRDADWMVTRAVPGEDCIHPMYLEDPKKLSETLGNLLRILHNTDCTGCPIVLPHLEKDEPVLIHGDYCLPNVMLDNWRFSGFIDVGSGGIGDRHIDLYWGCWSIQYNLKDSRWCSRFLDAYGREAIDREKLRRIHALEFLE